MHELNAISLFTGSAQLDRGARAALEQHGYTFRTVAYVEQSKFATEVIRARIRDGFLDDAPIWPDVRTFPGRRYRGHVDAIVGGFPCQDLSHAGKREGLGAGTRSGLFFNLLDVAVECDAACVLLENVEGIYSTAADCTLRDDGDAFASAAAVVSEALAEKGFDAIWCDLSAEDLGAPHGRPRWWCIAWRRDV